MSNLFVQHFLKQSLRDYLATPCSFTHSFTRLVRSRISFTKISILGSWRSRVQCDQDATESDWRRPKSKEERGQDLPRRLTAQEWRGRSVADFGSACVEWRAGRITHEDDDGSSACKKLPLTVRLEAAAADPHTHTHTHTVAHTDICCNRQDNASCVAHFCGPLVRETNSAQSPAFYQLFAWRQKF